MVAFISLLLTRAVKTKDGIDTAIILLLLGMMVAMLLGPAYLYLTTLGFGISDVVIWEIAVFMTLGMMPAAGLTAAKLVLLRRARQDRAGAALGPGEPHVGASGGVHLPPRPQRVPDGLDVQPCRRA